MNNFEVVEGNLKAVQDSEKENMWYLLIKDTRDEWKSVQWMYVYNIQELFQTKLPIF